jgi:hypothetical protein
VIAGRLHCSQVLAKEYRAPYLPSWLQTARNFSVSPIAVFLSVKLANLLPKTGNLTLLRHDNWIARQPIAEPPRVELADEFSGYESSQFSHG